MRVGQERRGYGTVIMKVIAGDWTWDSALEQLNFFPAGRRGSASRPTITAYMTRRSMNTHDGAVRYACRLEERRVLGTLDTTVSVTVHPDK